MDTKLNIHQCNVPVMVLCQATVASLNKPLKANLKTRALHVGANARLQLLLENSKSKEGHNYAGKKLRITSPTGKGSPFNS